MYLSHHTHHIELLNPNRGRIQSGLNNLNSQQTLYLMNKYKRLMSRSEIRIGSGYNSHPFEQTNQQVQDMRNLNLGNKQRH